MFIAGTADALRRRHWALRRYARSPAAPLLGHAAPLEIEPLDRSPSTTATVKVPHNFIADGLVAHNIIEQYTML